MGKLAPSSPRWFGSGAPGPAPHHAIVTQYVLFGEPTQMADALRERQLAYGLSRITIMAEPGITLAPPGPLRFCREVVPLL